MAAETTNPPPSILAEGLKIVCTDDRLSADDRLVLTTAAALCERYRFGVTLQPELAQRLMTHGLAQLPHLKTLLFEAATEIVRFTAATSPQFETFQDRGHRVNPDEQLAQQPGVRPDYVPTPKPSGLPAVRDIPAWLVEHATVVSCPITKWVCRMAACELELLRETLQPGPAVGPNPGTQASSGHYPADAKPLEPAHISDGDGYAQRLRDEQSAVRASQCSWRVCRTGGKCNAAGASTCAAPRFEGDGRL